MQFIGARRCGRDEAAKWSARVNGHERRRRFHSHDFLHQ